MTVKELIDELSQYPKDMKVFCGADHCESTEEVGSVIKENYSWHKDRGDFLYILAE